MKLISLLPKKTIQIYNKELIQSKKHRHQINQVQDNHHRVGLVIINEIHSNVFQRNNIFILLNYRNKDKKINCFQN